MFTRRRVVPQLACALLAVLPAGCWQGAHQRPAAGAAVPPPAPVRVVVSTPLLAELVQQVGGGGVEVEVLVPVDEPPSSLRRTGPTESRLIAADLVVLLGFGQEAVLAPSLERAAAEGAVVCELGPTLPADRLFPRPDDPAQTDPHIWLDPALWSLATRPVEEALAALRPLWAVEIRKRAHAVRFELEEAERELQRVAQSMLAPEPRPVRVSKPGLRYLARVAGVATEPVGTDAPVVDKDDLEKLALDLLRPPGTRVVANVSEHDLGTVEGLRAYALDLLMMRQH